MIVFSMFTNKLSCSFSVVFPAFSQGFVWAADLRHGHVGAGSPPSPNRRWGRGPKWRGAAAESSAEGKTANQKNTKNTKKNNRRKSMILRKRTSFTNHKKFVKTSNLRSILFLIKHFYIKVKK